MEDVVVWFLENVLEAGVRPGVSGFKPEHKNISRFPRMSFTWIVQEVSHLS